MTLTVTAATPTTTPVPGGDCLTRVQIPGALRGATGGAKYVPVFGSTVRDALDELVTAFPGLQPAIFAPSGRLHDFVNIFVGAEHIRCLDGLDTPTVDRGSLFLLPAMSGGG